MLKEMYLDELPTLEGSGSKKKVNWKESIGYKVRFVYDDIDGVIEIVDCIGENLYVKYLDKDLFKISSSNFKNCRLGRLLDKYTINFKIKTGTQFKDKKRNIIIVDREHRRDESTGKNKNGMSINVVNVDMTRVGWKKVIY